MEEGGEPRWLVPVLLVIIVAVVLGLYVLSRYMSPVDIAFPPRPSPITIYMPGG